MLLEYLTLFLLAAIPLLELLVVIPLGIGYGLPPVSVAVVVFFGNTLPILGIVLLYDRWLAWRRARMTSAPGDPGPDPATGRRRRARELWVRYGLPGLALLAPLVTGVHLATAMALALGSPRRTIAAWMTFAIAVWTVGVTIVSYYGIEGVRHLL